MVESDYLMTGLSDHPIIGSSDHRYDITAIIVTHKSPLGGVRKAVESFLATPLDVHLIIVDNASGAEYFSELQTLANERVTVLSSGENRGFGAGNNYGLLRAPHCRYLLFMNPDVVVHEGTLETLYAYMESHPDVGLATPKVFYESGELQPLNKRDPRVLDLLLRRFMPPFLQEWPPIRRRMEHYMMMDVGYEKECEVEFVTGCFMFFRKSILDRIGGFDDRFFMYLEDADISRRTREIARAVYHPAATITHSWRRGSHKSIRLMLVMCHSILVYFTKWGWKLW